MLLRFSVENFKSIKARQEFSMIPSKVSQHKTHVISPRNRHDIGVLKAGVIYGANASGKSNVIKAMRHAQLMITQVKRAGQSLPFEPFKLDKLCLRKPSHFEFEIKCNNVNYAYGFVADHKTIYEEWLCEIDKNKDNVIYERSGDNFELTGIEKLLGNEKAFSFIEFTASGTPSNRLLLTECFERNVYKQFGKLKALEDVFNWFKQSLNIVFPSSKYEGLEFELSQSDDLAALLTESLISFDTGVSNLTMQELDFYLDVDLPKNVKEKVANTLEEGESAIVAGPNNRYHIERDEHGQIVARKVMTARVDSDGDEILFDLNIESDGTQRLIDLAPGLIELRNKEKVYIIDEIDRSLHPDITTHLLSEFLVKTVDKLSQLIVTTHETNLLNLELLRRDEIWFTAKDQNGCSELYSLEEYKPRFDNDVRKGYLMGRFGALPKIKELLNDKKEAVNNAT